MFYDNISQICTAKGTTPTTILKELGYSSGNVSQWKKGSAPNVDMALAIARRLGVSLDYLIALEPLPGEMVLTADQNEWLEIASRIPDDKKEMCKDFLRTHMAVPEKYEGSKNAYTVISREYFICTQTVNPLKMRPCRIFVAYPLPLQRFSAHFSASQRIFQVSREPL